MLRLLGLLIFIRSTISVEYKIGMIVARKCCHRTSLYRTGGAVNIAMDHLRANNIVNGVDFRYVFYPGGRGYSKYFSCVGSGPASTLHHQKISGISSYPKKYLKF